MRKPAVPVEPITKLAKIKNHALLHGLRLGLPMRPQQEF